MKQFVVNADDFGLCPGVNLGILHAHREGIVTSTTLMVNMPAAAEAVELARSTPTLAVGIHINLTAGRPVAAGVDSLTGPDGQFRKLPELALHARPEHLETEIRAQVRAFLAHGLKPSHLDSHHHVHLELPAAGAVVAVVGRELSVPVRGSGSTHFISSFYGSDSITPEWLIGTLAQLPDGVSELMCHPAYLDPYLLSNSRYALERVRELATLVDPRVREAVTAGGIHLVNYWSAARATLPAAR